MGNWKLVGGSHRTPIQPPAPPRPSTIARFQPKIYSGGGKSVKIFELTLNIVLIAGRKLHTNEV